MVLALSGLRETMRHHSSTVNSDDSQTHRGVLQRLYHSPCNRLKIGPFLASDSQWNRKWNHGFYVLCGNIMERKDVPTILVVLVMSRVKRRSCFGIWVLVRPIRKNFKRKADLDSSNMVSFDIIVFKSLFRSFIIFSSGRVDRSFHFSKRSEGFVWATGN